MNQQCWVCGSKMADKSCSNVRCKAPAKFLHQLDPVNKNHILFPLVRESVNQTCSHFPSKIRQHLIHYLITDLFGQIDSENINYMLLHDLLHTIDNFSNVTHSWRSVLKPSVAKLHQSFLAMLPAAEQQLYQTQCIAQIVFPTMKNLPIDANLEIFKERKINNKTWYSVHIISDANQSLNSNDRDKFVQSLNMLFKAHDEFQANRRNCQIQIDFEFQSSAIQSVVATTLQQYQVSNQTSVGK